MISVKLDDDTIAMVGLLYHTADKKENPDDTSWYMYEGRTAKIKDLEAEIAAMKSLEHRLDPWRWPDPRWPEDWFMGYDDGDNNMKGQRFLTMKLKKALSWEAYLDLVLNGVKTLGNGTKKAYPSGRYETKAYTDQDGQIFDITDKDALLARVGKCFSKKMPLKRDSRPKA